jgi:hypothetical protein
MTTLTDRQQYRELVATVAAKAKAILPQEVNGRVESAAKLVLNHDVEVLTDGSIQVGSSSDPARVYLLVGTTCDCQDFKHAQAPQGWCQHRIAAGIDKRVRELLAALPAPPIAAPTVPLPEAPASVNVRVVVAGYEVQWTLRDTDETRLAGRLAALLAQYPKAGTASPGGAAPVPPPVCRFHGPMKASSKAPGSFYCTKRVHDGSYCTERGGAA